MFFLKRSVEASQTTSCNRRIFSVNIGNFSVPPLQNIGDKIFHSLNVVGNNSNSSIEYMVDRNHRNFGSHQLLYFFCKEVDAGNYNSVDSPVTAVIIITDVLTGKISAGKGDVVSSGFSRALETF